jgi:hypothetical protein
VPLHIDYLSSLCKVKMSSAVVPGVLTEETLIAIVADIVSDLQSSMTGFHLRKLAEVEVMKSSTRLADVKSGVTQLLDGSVFDKRLRNVVYQHLQTYVPRSHPSAAPDHAKEPISYIRRAQVQSCVTLIPWLLDGALYFQFSRSG